MSKSTSAIERPHVAITMGDPAGIGPEICVRVLADRSTAEFCRPVVFGDLAVLEKADVAVGRAAHLVACTLDDWMVALEACDGANVVDLANVDARALRPGEVDAATGRAAFEYIDAAIDAAMQGRVGAITTAPIHKEALRAAGIDQPGHTEILASRTEADRACMMLTSPELTCSFVTTHVGYRDVPYLLNRARILDVIELTHAALAALNGRTPVLAVCGLNPHAGEHGLFGGSEEEKHIAPAIEAARRRGFEVDGPLPPDTASLPTRRAETDGYICMYHDQGHIPLKALAFDLAVNVTLGLPIIRTSVDHGTALDIAWQGRANPKSLFEAIRLAARLHSGCHPAA